MAFCRIFIISDNETGKRFWAVNGWEQRSGFYVYSKSVKSLKIKSP